MKTFAIWAFMLCSIVASQDVQLLKIRGGAAFTPPSSEEVAKSIQQIQNLIRKIDDAKIDRKVKDPTIEEASSVERVTFSSRASQKAMAEQLKNKILELKNDIWNQVPWTIPTLESDSLVVGKAGRLRPAWKDAGRSVPRLAPALAVGSAEAARYFAQVQALGDVSEDVSCPATLIERKPDGAVLCSVGDYIVLIYGLKPEMASKSNEITVTNPLYVKNVRTVDNVQIPELHPLDPKIIDDVKAEVRQDVIKKRMRDWKSVDRKFTVQAALISLADKKATIQKPDQSKIEIELIKLSKADRDYCEQMLGIPK